MNMRTQLAVLKDAFVSDISSIRCLTRESPRRICRDYPHSNLGSNPVVICQFDRAQHHMQNLLIGHTRDSFAIEWADDSREAINDFASNLNIEDAEIRALSGAETITGVFDLTPFIMPIDPVAGVPFRVSEVIVVEDTQHQMIRSLGISFMHGTKVSFTTGIYNEFAVLFNDQVQFVIDQAERLSLAGKVCIHRISYPTSTSTSANAIASIPWFID